MTEPISHIQRLRHHVDATYHDDTVHIQEYSTHWCGYQDTSVGLKYNEQEDSLAKVATRNKTLDVDIKYELEEIVQSG